MPKKPKHNYNTRRAQRPNIELPKFEGELYRRAPEYRAKAIWEAVPVEVQKATTKVKSKQGLKNLGRIRPLMNKGYV